MKTARTGPPRRGLMLPFSHQNLPKNRKKENQRTVTCNCSVGRTLHGQVSCSWREPGLKRGSMKGEGTLGEMCISSF